MENIKQQIEELRKQLKESYKENRKQIWKLEEVLQQQVNKPKIEVGKVYDIQFNMKKDINYIVGMITKIDFDGKIWFFGFKYNGYTENDYFVHYDNVKSVTYVTKEEWETALTKHADKIYEGVEKVDRSCIDISLDPIVKFRPYQDSSFDEDGFMYKGRYVMNSSGVWAKPCEKIDCDLNIQNGRAIFKTPNLEDGKYKLVKVG